MRNRLLIVSFIAVVSFFAGYILSPTSDSPPPTSASTPITFFTCPMHPHIHQNEEGRCPLCGMSLVKKTSNPTSSDPSNSIRIDAAVINHLSIKSTVVKRGNLYRELLTYGYVNKVESTDSQLIKSPITGHIIYNSNKRQGDETKKGELLFTIESLAWQELQQDYLNAVDERDAETLRTINQQLLAAGFSLADIQALKSMRKPNKEYSIYAQKSGVVHDVKMISNQVVNTGDVLLALAPLFPITGYAEIFEGQWQWLEVGQKVSMIIRSIPNVVWQGEVLTVDDILMNRSRTIKTKLGFKAQPNIRLKAGMHANFSVYASPKNNVLYVPQDAVIRTGATTRVMLAMKGGRFKALSVRAGLEDGQRIEILEGVDNPLKEGMRVVTSGQFLLDSASQLKIELQRMRAITEKKDHD